MLSWKWGKRMIYYVKRYATPRMSKDKKEKAKWMKGKYFRNPKRYSQKVLGQFLMEVKAGVVLPVFDPNTVNIQVTTKEVDDDDKFDKKATPAEIKVHENFPVVPPSDTALVDTDNDGKPEEVPIKRPKDLKKTYFPKKGQTEVFVLTPHEATHRFDPANPTAGGSGSASAGSSASSFV
jgi:hypothetical protein